MTSKQKLAIALLLFAISSIYSAKILTRERNMAGSKEMTLYYGDTCPHCKVVEDYIAANGLNNKLKIERKEIFNSAGNQKEMAQRLAACGRQKEEKLYVPMLFDAKNNACYGGEENEGSKDIIEFLRQRAGI